MTVRREIAQNTLLVKRFSYLACDDIDTLIPPCASLFTNDEGRSTPQRRIRDCGRSVHE
jgi:hypothetical protein